MYPAQSCCIGFLQRVITFSLGNEVHYFLLPLKINSISKENTDFFYNIKYVERTDFILRPRCRIGLLICELTYIITQNVFSTCTVHLICTSALLITKQLSLQFFFFARYKERVRFVLYRVLHIFPERVRVYLQAQLNIVRCRERPKTRKKS